MRTSIVNYLNNIFASKRVLGTDKRLNGFARANRLLEELVAEGKVPGLSITVLRDGKTVLQKGYGYVDLEKKTLADPINTLYRIASVSKPIAATALAHCVAENIIDLDASFYNYVPYYPEKKYDFTIRQLASHTAGIRGYQGSEYGLNKPYSIKEGIEVFKDDELIFQPGTDYHYNSFDWVLISLAIQEVTGVPFEQYVQEKVLNPLALLNTFVECHKEHTISSRSSKAAYTSAIPSNGNLHIPVFYSKNRLGFRKAIQVNNFYKLAGGGYLSTSKDIAQFGQKYLDGTILNPEVLTQFLSSENLNGKKTYYGLGWQVSEDAMGRPFYGHIGNGVGGYSNFFVYPEQKMVFSILTNCTNPKIQLEFDEVINELM